MTRNEAIELLEKYNDHLMKEGFADSDLWCEPPTAIDGFMGTKWAKENLPLGKFKWAETPVFVPCNQFSGNDDGINQFPH